MISSIRKIAVAGLMGILVGSVIIEETKAGDQLLTKSQYNLNDPALNKCFKKWLGGKRYNAVIYSGLLKSDEKEKKLIAGCERNPDYMPVDFYDIFDGNKVESCVSSAYHVFTHEITKFNQIEKIERWGQTPQGFLKNHTYIFLKNKGYIGNRVDIARPVPVYAPTDSYLILQARYRIQGFPDVQWRLIFQVGCEIVYRFDHLDMLSKRILKHLGNIPINEDQVSAPNVAIRPPLKITSGELVGYTKGTPQAGSWDFGVVNINNKNKLPKRLRKYENRPAGKQYKYAACPYDYYGVLINERYLSKIRGGKCNPKEIK